MRNLGWSVEPVKLEFYFHRLIKFVPKLFTKLHDSVSRIQNFPVSEGAQPPSDTPCTQKDIVFKVELLT